MEQEKRSCGQQSNCKPQTDRRIQPGDEMICRKCGRVVSAKWSYCPDCGLRIMKNPAL